MVEKKKSGYWLTHLGLILGVLFIFFPVWLTFVASTVTQDAIIYPPLPMLPGTEFFENYANALFRGSPEGYGAKVPVIKMMMNSAIMAIGITVGKIIISLLSADNNEMIIFPTVIPIAIIAEFIIIFITGTFAPYPSGEPLNKAFA